MTKRLVSVIAFQELISLKSKIDRKIFFLWQDQKAKVLTWKGELITSVNRRYFLGEETMPEMP